MSEREEPRTHCQTWGYYSGRRCELPQGHVGRHRLEPVIGEPPDEREAARPEIDVERADDEHAALLLAAAMSEAGFRYHVGDARRILDFLAAPDEAGWDTQPGWGLVRLQPSEGAEK